MLIPAWLKDPRRHRAVFVLALPMVFSNVTTPLLGLVDTWVIGHLGQAWFLGGVSVGATFINLLFWLLGFLRMSTTGLTAQAQGAAHAEGQLDTLARALGLAIGLGMALLLLLLPFLPAIIALGGGSSEVQTYAGQYVSVRVWSAPAALCNLVIMGWLLGMQDARSPMLLLILGNLVNMVLDAWFVLGLGWQVKGVAAASLLADYSTLGVGFWLVSRHLRRLDPGVWHNAWQRWRQWPALLRLLALNRDIFIRSLCLQLCFVFMTLQGARLGDVAVAANAVLLNFLMLISYGLDGFAYAVEAMVGRAIGRRDRPLLRWQAGCRADAVPASAWRAPAHPKGGTVCRWVYRADTHRPADCHRPPGNPICRCGGRDRHRHGWCAALAQWRYAASSANRLRPPTAR